MHRITIRCLTNPFLMFGLLLAGSIVVAHSAEIKRGNTEELSFLTWPEYISPDAVRKFEELHHARVKMVYFNSDTERDEILVKDEGSNSYDIALVDGVTIRQYRKRGWLSPITIDNTPNIRHIDKSWMTQNEDISGYAIPYLWGTLGIAYRRDLTGEEITSWKQLFDPKPEWSGKVFMIKDARELTAMAMKALGYSMNSSDLNELREAHKLLQKQKQHVKSYEYMDLRDTSPLYTGEGYLSMAYNGDALSLQELDPNIVFVLPDEGGSIWVDYITVMKGSRQKELAYRFIDFLNEPENAAELAQYAYNATPNSSAEKRLPKEFLDDKIVYPKQEALQNSETYKVLPPKVMREINIIFSDITSDQ